jgi:hypothetical protein
MKPMICSFFENYQHLHLIMSHAVKLKPVQAAHLSIVINEACKLHKESTGDTERSGNIRRERRPQSFVDASGKMQVSRATASPLLPAVRKVDVP